MMAWANITLFMIQLFGRWGSMSIARYVQEAHLSGNPQIAKQALAGLASHGPAANATVCPAIQDATEASTELVPLSVLDQEPLLQLIRSVSQQAIDDQRKYIHNPATKKAHFKAVPESGTDSLYWHSPCKWYYGRSPHVGQPNVAANFNMCQKCVASQAKFQSLDHLEDFD